MAVTRKNWVDACASAKYEHGIDGCLRSIDNKYCPLGVLADLLVKAGAFGLTWEKGDDRYYLLSPDGTKDKGYLPAEVRVTTGVAIAHWHIIRQNDGLRVPDNFKGIGEFFSKDAADKKKQSI